MRPRRARLNIGAAAARAALVLLLIFSVAALAGELHFPPLTGRVVDDAGVLSASTQSRLIDMLAQHEKATGQQVVVVTLPSLQGVTIEDFGYQLGRYWGIGQKGTNNGALLIVAPKEHKVRIEVGYGLEGTMTDAISSTIIHQEILPAFRRGDINTGVLAGTMSILSVLSGETAMPPSATAPQPYQMSDAMTFFILALIILFIIGWCAIMYLGLKLSTRTSRYSGYGDVGGWGGRGWSGGGGGGGFSGGGGSFGGGGASGSW
jgi:uncharacterized protein